jgi:GGDEF domain-containing protein
MAIISLKRYLNANSDHAPLRQIISLLIARMGSSAVEGDVAECAAFRVDMKLIADGLDPDLPAGSLLIQAETALQALAIHNKRIESLLASQGNEVSHILGMLQDTVINIAGENTRSAKRLREITVELEQSGAITDLRVLKGRLTECLKGLREETLQQKADAAATVQKLQMTIERSQSGAGAVAKPGNRSDPVTGLLCRDDALIAMQTAIDGGARQYAVAMVVNRVQMINVRFGHEVGDRMLVGFKEHVEKQLLPAGQLFRWAGPALVAIIERPEPIGNVRVQVKRMLDSKIEVMYTGEGRSVLIPISAGWSALPLISTADADKQIGAFIASQTSGNIA